MAKRKDIEIVRVLIERQDKELNILEISRHAKTDYKNTYLIIKNLEKEGIITLQSFGKNKRVILNKKPHPIIYAAEYKRKQELLRNKNFLVIHDKLSALNFPFIAMIFGSYIKSTPTKNSDIDLLIICEKEREKIIQNMIDLFPLNIHATIIGFEDFMKMLKSKEFSVVSEAAKNNVILVGIEDYYRVVENAG